MKLEQRLFMYMRDGSFLILPERAWRAELPHGEFLESYVACGDLVEVIWDEEKQDLVLAPWVFVTFRGAV